MDWGRQNDWPVEWWILHCRLCLQTIHLEVFMRWAGCRNTTFNCQSGPQYPYLEWTCIYPEFLSSKAHCLLFSTIFWFHLLLMNISLFQAYSSYIHNFEKKSIVAWSVNANSTRFKLPYWCLLPLGPFFLKNAWKDQVPALCIELFQILDWVSLLSLQ